MAEWNEDIPRIFLIKIFVIEMSIGQDISKYLSVYPKYMQS